jgi:ssDNA-binding Zn-finger/Zn-ribbon topoisomerase 1
MNKTEIKEVIADTLSGADITNDKEVAVCPDDGDFMVYYRERKEDGKWYQYEIRIGGGYEIKKK